MIENLNHHQNVVKELNLKEKDESGEADFETAIAATGFGKFNLILLTIAIPCGWAAMFDSTAMSYVLPEANCDLDLNLEQRGMLNAITYLGMITSACVWGFLADTLGRKKLLIVGYLADAVCVAVAGFSQTYAMLLTAKYLTGFIINGPFAALTSVLSEFHAAKYRARILLVMGTIYGFANLVLPLIAWTVLPNEWDATIFGSIKLHSWNFFILICAAPSLISALSHVFLPESPKFLMMVGKNEEALRVFRTVYSLNTGKPPEDYPVKKLVDEIKQRTVGKHGGAVTANRSSVQALKEGWQQIAPLFFPPHLFHLILVCTMQIGFMCGGNTLRLWLPQIFTAINDYLNKFPDTEASLCSMLESITPKSNVSLECDIENVDSSRDLVYTNVVIVAAVTIIAYMAAGALINKIGKKTVMIVLGLIGGTSGFCMYFAQDVATTTILSSLNNALIGVCCNVQITVVVDLFPTSLRTIAISLLLMIGRIGAMIGNLLFPILLQVGCLHPFLMTGCLVIGCTMLTFLLPKTDMKALE